MCWKLTHLLLLWSACATSCAIFVDSAIHRFLKRTFLKRWFHEKCQYLPFLCSSQSNKRFNRSWWTHPFVDFWGTYPLVKSSFCTQTITNLFRGRGVNYNWIQVLNLHICIDNNLTRCFLSTTAMHGPCGINPKKEMEEKENPKRSTINNWREVERRHCDWFFFCNWTLQLWSVNSSFCASYFFFFGAVHHIQKSQRPVVVLASLFGDISYRFACGKMSALAEAPLMLIVLVLLMALQGE